MVQEINNKQVVAFLTIEKATFINGRMTYASIKDPMKRTYMETVLHHLGIAEVVISSLLALSS